MNLFISQLFSNPDFFFIQVMIVVFSICCHEYSHARVALWQGDSTAADRGHLTLNPFVQMGAFSLVLLMIVGIAWGKVPVTPSRMKHRYSDALVSFAGPAMNILLSICFIIGYTLVIAFEGNQMALLFFHLGAVMNIVLFLINMAPVPGLDGWGVYTFLFPKMHNVGSSELGKGLLLGGALLLFTGIGYLFELASAAVQISAGLLYHILTVAGIF